MEHVFEYLQHDMTVILAMAALCAAIAIAAVWLLLAANRRRNDNGRSGKP